MNPIWRAAANGLSRSRSEGQIRMEKQREIQKQKRRQEKEKRRVDALEREKKWMALEKVPGKKEDGSSHEESAAEKFQKELCWCIQQLEMGLANMKPNPKQAQEVERVLRTLKSPKAPIAKKRQVMRGTFGDYRSKMLQEEKKHVAAMASKTNICKVAPNVINQATFFRKSSGLGVHQRSVSVPAAYAPSLSPTEEEAGGGGGKGRTGAVSVEPSEENKDKHREIEGESSTAESVDNKIKDEQQDSGNHAEENCQVLTAGEEGGGEGSVSIGENETTNSQVAGDHQHLLASVGRESPTHSIVSTVSSDSFNPPTTSSSSSLSSHELTPSSQPQSCQTFRFDFRIEEEEKGREGEKEVVTMTEKDESAKNRRNEDNKEVEKVVGMPLTEGGNSPVIEGISAKEIKKKRRNRKKKKKKVSELVGEDKEKEEGENDQENQKESINSQVELSLGGGEFKFNFDDKVAKS